MPRAQDPRARNRQHRVPAGGSARAGSARRALRLSSIARACCTISRIRSPAVAILRSLLPPGGVMRVGLYSEMARAGRRARAEFIAERGFAPTPAGIRACRAAIPRAAGRPAARAGGEAGGLLQRERMPRSHLPRPGTSLHAAADRERSRRARSRFHRLRMAGHRCPARAIGPAFPTIAAADRSRPLASSSKPTGPTPSC